MGTPLTMNQPQTRPQMRAAGLSVRGPVRTVNQDTVYFDIAQVKEQAEPLGLFIVCDGLGGHRAGDWAGQTAVSVIVSALSAGLSRALHTNNGPENQALHQLVESAITEANAHIYRQAPKQGGPGGQMGTTVALALVYGCVAYMAGVGDSRIYLLRQGQLAQITRDHSLAAELARSGNIGHHEIAGHPTSHVLTRALGTAPEVKVDQFGLHLMTGDRLLLCSDGLWKALPDSEELGRLLAGRQEGRVAPKGLSQDLIQGLVDEAVRRDGSDNVSAVLVDLELETAYDHIPAPGWAGRFWPRRREQSERVAGS
jgi:PPM family protein phosphatase